VTLRLLWLEYLSRHPEGCCYTQFCEHFRAWQQRSRPRDKAAAENAVRLV